MIILFEENETLFTNLGLGVLSEAISVVVTEKLDYTYELSMTYPVNGANYSKLKDNRILYCKPNPYDEAQPFRIINIEKPIKGVVTVNAVHISYDMNGIPVKAIDGKNLDDVLTKIQNKYVRTDTNEVEKYALLENNFVITTDISSATTFKTTAPYNLRALLVGSDESIVPKYKAEVKFDKFVVQLLAHRGLDRGAQVVYGHNMTDLNHKISTENLYNGVFPYYHTEKTSTETTTDDKFKQVYIVGSKPLQDGWLSYSKDGEPYHPIDESPVQIATEGDYKDKVYVWNSNLQRYELKIYDEQVTLIQGAIEPTWISIDWSKFPKVVCKANRKGYFKSATDTEWGEIKGVGDVIFEDSLISSGIISNIVLKFAEVIPTSGESSNTEVTEIVDVQLDDPIIWLDSPEAKMMKHDKILCLDLSSEFDEEPSKERLKAKAEEFIIENKIGQIKHSTTVSFIDLSSTTDADKYKNFDHIELGDTVRIKYLDLGVDVSLRVITAQYDVLAKRYSSIELGEKEENMSGSSVETGDNISSLTNDVGYASVTTVHKLIAETVTANYLEAVNARMSQAMIKQLEVERIDCKGIFEASQFTVDELVARLMTADNALIKDTLTAGKIKIAGDLTILQGEIRIKNEEDGESYFYVDRNGNVIANSVEITGGTLNINDGVFEVQNDGTMFAKNAFIEGEIIATAGTIGDCTIVDGVLEVPSANIIGTITANSLLIKDGANQIIFSADNNSKIVQIAGFDVNSYRLKAGEIISFEDDEHDGIYIGTDGIRLGSSFFVNPAGDLEASSVTINGGVLNFNNTFTVDNDGTLIALNAFIEGQIVSTSGRIGQFNITNSALSTGIYGTDNSIYLGSLRLKGYASNNQLLGNTSAVIRINIQQPIDSFTLYIRANGEPRYDYVIVSTPTATTYPQQYNDSNAYDSTYNEGAHSGTTIHDYKEVIYHNLVPGNNIYVVYIKDATQSSYDDTGYVLLPVDETQSKYTITSNITNYKFVEDSRYDIYLTNVRVGNKFMVDNHGILQATDVDLTGKITATSGKIADLSISNNGLNYADASYNQIFSINPKASDNIFTEEYTLYSKSARFGLLYTPHASDTYNTGAYLGILDNDGFANIFRSRDGTLSDSYRSNITIQDLAKIPIVQSYIYEGTTAKPSGTIAPRIFATTITATAVGSRKWQASFAPSVHGMSHSIIAAVASHTFAENQSSVPDLSGNVMTKIDHTTNTVYVTSNTNGSQPVSIIIIGW